MITGHGDTETLRTPDYETALDAAPRSGGLQRRPTASSALRVSVSLWLVI